MPIHDWSRVDAGIFHDFYLGWIVAIQSTLNNGILPDDYYALAEQSAGRFAPDVLTLQTQVRFTAAVLMDQYLSKQRTIVIHHASDDRVIALIEIVSPGHKASRHGLRAFVDKATEALNHGYHLLTIDLQPPGSRDPNGIHGAIWNAICDGEFAAPPDKPLTLAAYSAGPVEQAYVAPIAVGDVLPDMPLFLQPEAYVNVPLEATYQTAWDGVPRRWRRVLEAPSA